MASCSPFKIEFSGSAQDLYKKVETLVKQHNGTIEGGPAGGKFSIPIPVFGAVAGTYKVAKQTCTIHITQRSFFLACGTIENFIKSHIPTVAKTSAAEF